MCSCRTGGGGAAGRSIPGRRLAQSLAFTRWLDNRAAGDVRPDAVHALVEPDDVRLGGAARAQKKDDVVALAEHRSADHDAAVRPDLSARYAEGCQSAQIALQIVAGGE